MVLIFEGLDKTGKTTAAQGIAKALGARYVKVSQPVTKRPFLEYARLFAALDSSKDYVFDRAYLGERAYGPVYRGNDLTDAEQAYLELQLLAHDAKLVYCYRDLDLLAADYPRLGETFTRVEDLKKLNKLFDRAVSKSILPVYHYKNFAGLDAVKEFVMLSKRSVPVNFPALGSADAHFVLLGDERNPRAWVPGATFGSRCGMFLIEALQQALPRCSLRAFRVVNSKDLGTYLARAVHGKVVVCLGKKSAKRLSAADPEKYFYEVPHPQHALRFGGTYSRAVEAYAQKLKEVLS